MAYDEETAERFRALIRDYEGITEKRMMGAVCFFLNGNMIGGADRAKSGQRRLMFRVGKANRAAAEAMPGAEPMVLGERRMAGFVFVDAAAEDATLRPLLSMALEHAFGLPPK